VDSSENSVKSHTPTPVLKLVFTQAGYKLSLKRSTQTILMAKIVPSINTSNNSTTYYFDISNKGVYYTDITGAME
jgi:hypothetical protein